MAENDSNPEDAYTRTTRAQCIVCREDKLLMVQHHYEGVRWWCLPGGAVEPGETEAQAALRELEEVSYPRSCEKVELHIPPPGGFLGMP